MDYQAVWQAGRRTTVCGGRSRRHASWPRSKDAAPHAALGRADVAQFSWPVVRRGHVGRRVRRGGGRYRGARIYDTRKTTPGWRRLEKYAVRSGGGHNHRTGLFDAILIKDNHLALGQQPGGGHFTPAEAVLRARQFREQATMPDPRASMLIEIEVDSLAQLDEVLPAGPDIVLLDNMSLAELCEAVRRRNELAPGVELEASGGVNLATVRQIAETGVDRISVGALTHSAVWLDVALDWQS